jgi:hypothetical protein
MITSIPDGPSTCNHEAARLLPWLVAGALSAPETERVQKHIDGCAVCTEDLEHERRMQALICEEPVVEYAPQPGLQNLMNRIDEVERELPSLQAGNLREHSHVSRRRFGAIRWLAAAVIVQTVGLGVLGTLFWQRGVELRAPRFHTMTSSVPESNAAQLRVVFAPGMTMEAVQSLLSEIKAGIVSGPSDAGVYALSLQPGAATAESVLMKLRANENVMFAEPQHASDSPPQ